LIAHVAAKHVGLRVRCRLKRSLPGEYMSLSVFDIFKVGLGRSSSHTWSDAAAREFALGLKRDGLLAPTEEIAVRL